jgi:cob(I)alamin adenosyltransferase
MPKIYTKTGDSGETSLLSGGRVAKDHALVEAYGTVDELNSQLGLFLSEPLPDVLLARCADVQATLFNIGSALADPERHISHNEEKWSTEQLELWIDEMEEDLEPLREFVLPGGSRAAALAHVARTVCRRAERRVSGVGGAAFPGGVLAYLNRLSDWLFVVARWLNARVGVTETRWTGGGSKTG